MQIKLQKGPICPEHAAQIPTDGLDATATLSVTNHFSCHGLGIMSINAAIGIFTKKSLVSATNMLPKSVHLV